jgi:hypothetical protein
VGTGLRNAQRAEALPRMYGMNSAARSPQQHAKALPAAQITASMQRYNPPDRSAKSRFLAANLTQTGS